VENPHLRRSERRKLRPIRRIEICIGPWLAANHARSIPATVSEARVQGDTRPGYRLSQQLPAVHWMPQRDSKLVEGASRALADFCLIETKEDDPPPISSRAGEVYISGVRCSRQEIRSVF